MVNPEAMEKIEELLRKYRHNWGHELVSDYIPPGMSQEKLAVVPERITETGESVSVGWNKCFPKSRSEKTNLNYNFTSILTAAARGSFKDV